eukprot:1965861-Rhodomonas_salina.2
MPFQPPVSFVELEPRVRGLWARLSHDSSSRLLDKRGRRAGRRVGHAIEGREGARIELYWSKER